MDQSSLVTPSELGSSHSDKNEQSDGSPTDVNREKHKSSLDSTYGQGNDEKFSRIEDRSARGQPTVDIAEVLRRWTHALQRIHKQSVQLVCFYLCGTSTTLPYLKISLSARPLSSLYFNTTVY